MLTLKTLLIIGPLCFLGGMVDAIGGGGGLITLPAFLLAGLPAHTAIGTNKLQSVLHCGVSTARYAKNGFVLWRLMPAALAGAILGAALGARLNLVVDEAVLRYVLPCVLPVCAFFVLRKKSFAGDENAAPPATAQNLARIFAVSLVVGCYDGFFGPGAGTFLIMGFSLLLRMGVRYAGGSARLINFTTCLSSGVVYFIHGQVLVLPALAAGACAMLGSWLGAGLAMKNGAKIVRPVILLVLALLLLKILFGW